MKQIARARQSFPAASFSQCWLGETNFDFDYEAEGTFPNATAIQINGNDHFVLDTIVRFEA